MVVLWGGCSDSKNKTTSDGSGAGDPSSALFVPDTIVTVEIQMAPADWDFVRQDKRDLSGLYGEDCMTGPLYSTYTWKPATSVTVNGEVLENVGIRKKGFVGSVNDTKPGLKLKFDKYEQGQELFGKERLTLNNNTSDPSFIKQCLAYDLFRKAGLAAPRCNFATVKVNGQDLGLYSNVESVKKRFLARHFADNEGDLYESMWGDFRDDWLVTYEEKTSSTDTSRAKIKAVTAALKLPDDTLMAALSPLVDLDKFYTYWAMEVLVRHADGYANEGNNHFIYFDPGDDDKLHFIPWGVDKTFIPTSVYSFDVAARTILPRRLYNMKATQARYLDAMNKLLTDVWDEAELTAEIDRMEQLIGSIAVNDPYFKTGDYQTKGGGSADFASVMGELRDSVTARRAEIKKVIDNPPAWTDPLQEIECGGGKEPGSGTHETTGSFATTFGSLGSTDPFSAGSSTLSVKQDGTDLTVQQVDAQSGADPEASDRTVVDVIAKIDDPKGAYRLTARFSVANTAFVQGASITFGESKGDLTGSLFASDTPDKTWTLGTLSSGTLTLTKASLTAGEAVEGTFTAQWSSSTTTK
jgi:hypothetical protein